jgi:hypothetical protein
VPNTNAAAIREIEEAMNGEMDKLEKEYKK